MIQDPLLWIIYCSGARIASGIRRARDPRQVEMGYNFLVAAPRSRHLFIVRYYWSEALKPKFNLPGASSEAVSESYSRPVPTDND
jgi:hypothetical protein